MPPLPTALPAVPLNVCAEERCRQYGIAGLEVRHVLGDPRSRSQMQRLLDVTKYKAAFVVCGECV